MDILMVPLLLLIKSIISLIVIVVVTDVIFSWLVSFNIVNINNRFVYAIVTSFSRISNIMLNPIRRRLPMDFGGFDISPVILLLILAFFEQVLTRILLRFL